MKRQTPLLLAAMLLASAVHAAAAGEPDEWRALPDFTSGVWGYNFTPAATAQGGIGAAMPQLRPDAPRRSTRLATGETCTPIGVPTVMSKPYPFEFVYAPGRVTMLMEFDGLVRRIHTDGRKHPEDPDLTYGGYSIGRWEKDTLVVETIGLLPEVQIAPGVAADSSTRIVERMWLSGPDELKIATTVHAPAALAKPWTYERTYQRHRDWEVQEYYCQQNPRLTIDANGKSIPDLTRPE